MHALFLVSLQNFEMIIFIFSHRNILPPELIVMIFYSDSALDFLGNSFPSHEGQQGSPVVRALD